MRGARLFFVLAFVPTFLVFPYLRALNNPNEYVRVFTTMAIVQDHTFAIDHQVNTFGWVNDMARVQKKDGEYHYYMVKAPGSVYLAVPGYFLFSKVVRVFGHDFPTTSSSGVERDWYLRWATWACRFFGVQIPCFLFLIWFERFLRTFSSDVVLRLLSVGAAGLGTNYLAYEHMFASHALYAALAFASFGLAVRELCKPARTAKRRALAAFLCGWFASAAVMFEYHALFVVALLGLFGLVVFRKLTSALALVGGGLVNVPLVMFFHWRAYGTPLKPGHQLLENQQFAHEHQTGLWGVVWPTWEHVHALSLDPGFGLYAMSPFLALGFLAIPLVLLWPKERSLAIRRALRIATPVWIVAMIVLLTVNAGIIEWRAGWSIGPRYQGAAPPFYAFGALTALENVSRRSPWARAIARGVAGGLALASVVSIGVVGIVINTLPPPVTRPLAQVALPLIRTGFVPHHLAEWLGWTSTTFFYVVLACLIMAVTVFLFWRSGEAWKRYAARVTIAIPVFVLGMLPAFSAPEPQKTVEIPSETPWFIGMWEPPGRDRISLLRQEADRYGPRRPCLWRKLAYLERVVSLTREAASDERRASEGPQATCSRWVF